MYLSISDKIVSTWERLSGALTSFTSIKDIIDILFVAVIVYALITSLRKSQSIQILKGFIIIVVLYVIVNLFEMNASKFIFQSVFGNILLIMVVVFSAEIRQTLERVGHNKISFSSLFSVSKNDKTEIYNMINEICRACASMSNDKIGAIMIFQRKTYLGGLTAHGVNVDSLVNEQILESIFFPNSALHDGAIVINDMRIVAARCIVPLKNEKDVSEHVGTRHRAAIEISRTTDAFAVVVSEETGIISVAIDGKLTRGLTDSLLREKLIELLVDSDGDREKGRFKRFKIKAKEVGSDE